MKILITGSTGLLGQALVRQLAPSSEVVGLSRHKSPSCGATEHLVCDLTDARAVTQMIRHAAPEAVVHAQALSDVDRCEVDPDGAQLLNVQAMANLCEALKVRQPLLVMIGTDYVFDGAKGQPYDETDRPAPLSVYGKSKLAAEQLAFQYARGVVVRPSTLFGPGRMNFCDAIVQRLRRGEAVEAFADQTTSPTYTEDLAWGIQRLVEVLMRRHLHEVPRVYHMVNAGSCSRVEFARWVARATGYEEAAIHPILMEQQHRPAPRPAHSALISRHVTTVIGRSLRPWQEAVNAYLASQGWVN